jgi:diguanylate cyclase (GGDEF)-like protein
VDQANDATAHRQLSSLVVDEGEPTSLSYVVAIGTTLFVSWLITRELGGAGAVAPHWLYIPIMLCAYRFGFVPTLIVSLVSGFLVGPIMPDHFTNGVAFPQMTSDWVSRSIDFVVLGQFLTFLFRNLRRQRDAARASLYDPLTGLPNRVLFQDRLDQGLARLGRSHGALGVLFFDLDDFKTVNDEQGHLAGDELLVAISARLRGAARAGETLARISGDEFAMIAEGIDAAGTVEVAERMLNTLQAPFTIGGQQTSVRASIGVASTLNGSASSAELLHNADEAMYEAKRAGKNRYQVFQAEVSSASVAVLA